MTMRLDDMFERRMLERPWGRMAWWERAGEGPTVVFLHGASCDASDWLPLAQHLPEDLRLVLAEFRAHGHSEVPAEGFTFDDFVEDVQALLEEVDARKVVIVGHSLGGMVGMALAERDCDRLSALVLFEGWARVDAAPEDWNSAPELLSERDSARIKARNAATTGRVGPRKWLRFWKSVQEVDAADFLKSPPIRVIAVWGDRGGPRPQYDVLGFPPSLAVQHLWVEGQGHYMFIGRPKLCAHPVVRLANIARDLPDRR